MAEVKLNFIK